MSKHGYSKFVDSPSYGNYSDRPINDGSKQTQKKSRHNDSSGSSETSGLIAQPQNVKNKNVYVFSDGTVADAPDESIELSNMTQRSQLGQGQKSYKSTSRHEDVVTKEIPVEKTDTLRSLSIRFRCPVGML